VDTTWSRSALCTTPPLQRRQRGDCVVSSNVSQHTFSNHLVTSAIVTDRGHHLVLIHTLYHTTSTEATTRWLCCGQQLAATHFSYHVSSNVPRWHPLATTVQAEEFAGNYLAASIFKSYLTYKSNKFASHFYDAYMFSLVNSVQYKKKICMSAKFWLSKNIKYFAIKYSQLCPWNCYETSVAELIWMVQTVTKTNICTYFCNINLLRNRHKKSY